MSGTKGVPSVGIAAKDVIATKAVDMTSRRIE